MHASSHDGPRWTLVILAVLSLSAGASAPLYAAPPSPDMDAFIASLEGGWAGQNNVTPLGRMPFALLLTKENDGSLHAHSALNRETYIDLRFAKDEKGRFMLQEEAGMEASGSHRYVLAPTGLAGGQRRWSYEGDPDFLTIDVGVEADVLSMNVRLRGKDHVRFELARLPKEALPELRRQLDAAAMQSPEEGTSIHAILRNAQSGPAPEPVEAARRAVNAAPADARPRLALAQTLGNAIQENGAANGPRYAGEMLECLLKAVELDPTLVDAYHWLAGYYMEAPEIAGGSLDKADETARRLAAIDAAGAAELLAQIEARRAARHSGGAAK